MAGRPPRVDIDLELAVQAVCRHGIRQGWITSAHDCAEGGVAIALAESAIGGNLGATILLPDSPQRHDTLLFGEGGARIIVTVAPIHKTAWETYLTTQLNKRQWNILGTVASADTALTLQIPGATPLIDLQVTTLANSWHNAIERALGS